MPYTIPQLTLVQTPSHFSPVHSENWFAFTSSFAGSSANVGNLVVDVKILAQNNNLQTVIANVGRNSVPQCDTETYAYTPHTMLKSYVSYPYDNGRKIYYGTGEAAYVNEVVGYGNPTSSFPTISPEQEGIVKYCITYGLQYNPEADFTQMAFSVIGGVTYSLYLVTGLNDFAAIGDIVNIQVSSGLFSYFNGIASILNIFDDGTNTYVVTDQLANIPLMAASSGFISGVFNSATHIYGTSSSFYAYNGVRQFYEKDVNFDNVYYQRQGATTSLLFPSKSTTKNTQWMNDWGTTSSQCIPIMTGQGERGRFLIDLYGTASISDSIVASLYSTNRLAYVNLSVYDSGMNPINSYTHSIQDSPGGPKYPYKCFTMQLFGLSGALGGIQVEDGNKYKFSLIGLVPGGATACVYSSIWYKGIAPCTLYTNYRIKFLGRSGTWHYWNFYKDSKQTTNITRNEYVQPLLYDYTLNTIAAGGVATVNSPYSLSGLRGQNILSTDAQETFTLNTDWISEGEYYYLNQLLTSPQVFIFYDSYTLKDNSVVNAVNIPVIVTNPSHTIKTTNRDRLFNLSIDVKYAFPTRIQNA